MIKGLSKEELFFYTTELILMFSYHLLQDTNLHNRSRYDFILKYWCQYTGLTTFKTYNLYLFHNDYLACLVDMLCSGWVGKKAGRNTINEICPTNKYTFQLLIKTIFPKQLDKWWAHYNNNITINYTINYQIMTLSNPHKFRLICKHS